jgi:hypothetical protein
VVKRDTLSLQVSTHWSLLLSQIPQLALNILEYEVDLSKRIPIQNPSIVYPTIQLFSLPNILYFCQEIQVSIKIAYETSQCRHSVTGSPVTLNIHSHPLVKINKYRHKLYVLPLAHPFLHMVNQAQSVLKSSALYIIY